MMVSDTSKLSKEHTMLFPTNQPTKMVNKEYIIVPAGLNRQDVFVSVVFEDADGQQITFTEYSHSCSVESEHPEK